MEVSGIQRFTVKGSTFVEWWYYGFCIKIVRNLLVIIDQN